MNSNEMEKVLAIAVGKALGSSEEYVTKVLDKFAIEHKEVLAECTNEEIKEAIGKCPMIEGHIRRYSNEKLEGLVRNYCMDMMFTGDYLGDIIEYNPLSDEARDIVMMVIAETSGYNSYFSEYNGKNEAVISAYKKGELLLD